MALYIPDRHEVLQTKPWSLIKARQIITEIVELTIKFFQGDQLWPVHPDISNGYHLTQPITGLYNGAAGSIWALMQLQKRNTHLPAQDFTRYLDALISKQAVHLAEYDPKANIQAEAPGYLLGYAGINLLRWKLTHDANVLDILEDNIKSNITNPILELMWAAPGTMLCAWFLYLETGQQRWCDLYRQSAAYLFSSWEFDTLHQCYVWVQHIYGIKAIHLGVVHGFAGNVLVLLQGMQLLSDDQQQQLISRTEKTVITTAKIEGDLANWLPCLGEPRPGRDAPLVQLCHGAPSIVLGVASLWPLASEEFKKVLINAGNLIWQAGPLKKPWGLCHGTAGNGYAFLKLYKLTGDKIWYERALQFAMHAIHQYEAMRDHYACIRTDAWCGDLGLALYLQDCIDQRDKFPMMDYF
jgi:lantibiotic modifying enzyme